MERTEFIWSCKRIIKIIYFKGKNKGYVTISYIYCPKAPIFLSEA